MAPIRLARPGPDGKRVPDADRMVARAGSQPGAIGAEGNRMHIVAVPREFHDLVVGAERAASNEWRPP